MKLSDAIKVLQRRRKHINEILEGWTSATDSQAYRSYRAELAATGCALVYMHAANAERLANHVHEPQPIYGKAAADFTV